MEIWDIYDIDRIKQNKTRVRGSSYIEGDFHLVVHICVFNKLGQMLIQQRQPFKQGWSNLWDFTAGGSATKGDNSRTAASRELFEEIGLLLNFEEERPYLTINYEQGFDDFYLVELEVELEQLTLQYEEVQQVKWASKDEIIEKIREGQFVPYYESFVQLLFDSHKRRGCIHID